MGGRQRTTLFMNIEEREEKGKAKGKGKGKK